MSKKYLDDSGLSTLVSEILEHFQKKLTAGTNITIDEDNVISTSGGGTDTGATSITTSGSGNAVTTASYDASTRKITLTKGSTFLTSAVLSPYHRLLCPSHSYTLPPPKQDQDVFPIIQLSDCPPHQSAVLLYSNPVPCHISSVIIHSCFI